MKNKWKFEVNDSEWNTFCGLLDKIDEEKTTFKKMSKIGGKAYLHYLEVSYFAKDNLTDKQFSKIHSEVPISFINKFLK